MKTAAFLMPSLVLTLIENKFYWHDEIYDESKIHKFTIVFISEAVNEAKS